MTSAFLTFIATNPRHLRTIEVVVYEKQKFRIFQSTFANFFQNTASNTATSNLYTGGAIPQRVDDRMKSRYEKLFKQKKKFVHFEVEPEIELFQPPQPSARTTSSSFIPVQRSTASVCSIAIDLCSNLEKNINEVSKVFDRLL